MDPLTAFSLACGVIQVVDFSAKTLMKCKDILRDGSVSEHQEPEDLTKHIVDVQAKLNLPRSNQSAGSTHNPNKKNLLELANGCCGTADQLGSFAP